MQITIPIHSFIDVITNSSTEIYICTHNKTIEYAKEIIDSILACAGSELKADNLFDFFIEQKCMDCCEYGDKCKCEERAEENYNGYSESQLIIRAKATEPSNPTFQIAADILTDRLAQLFDTSACYEG